jgi:hypothetical protein
LLDSDGDEISNSDDPDDDNDGMPDAWEIGYFGATNAVNGGALDDWDQDGACNICEWVAGTDPTREGSVFAATGFEMPAGLVLSWFSESNKTYSIQRSDTLDGDFSDSVVTGIPATPPVNTQAFPADTAERSYYRIGVEP